MEQIKEMIVELGKKHKELEVEWEKLGMSRNLRDEEDLDGDIRMTSHLCNHEMIEYVNEIIDYDEKVKRGETIVYE